MDQHVPRAITIGLRLRGIKEGTLFNGVIYAHQLRISIGACVNDLELIATVADPDDLINGVIFLPLK